ncbi:chitinase [Microdochium trichocladiopsis]|uniref:chitinase n=1 Tax=Microdochium trichocladiopsis TaxID=1682393 RepID=A0A9P8YKX7_9PEZI|nr:chitinase [Microdochium trichocladiopsis]KAH7040899.1 chitinase [Microdochium trichocladiopsis]
MKSQKQLSLAALLLGVFLGASHVLADGDDGLLFADVVEQTGFAIAAEDGEKPDYTCSKAKPCKLGCCGPLDDEGNGVCGMGPDYCGKDCTGQCNEKSECDPGWGMQWSNASTCPLNVCCSKFGFCGTTADFCDGKTVPNPKCSGSSSDKRTIGYYEGWNYKRPCGNMEPEDIPLGWYTHINFAFALIDPNTFRIAPMDEGTAARYKRVTALKAGQPGLQVWIAIGGWAMNDPGPYRTTFSDLAKSTAAQDVFFESLLTFMTNNGFDGVDLDWEYPMAEDRGGIPEDFDNYVTFCRRLRERLNSSGRAWGITMTLPASYWYLRGFNLKELEPYLDWFNIMTYDIHGVWDSTVHSIGSFAYAHTNLTEIDLGLNLLWRNNVNPDRVVMGLGFYGRSFTMKDANCMAAGCPFASGAANGTCTDTAGVLSAAEIHDIVENRGATVTFDPVAACKIATWGDRQWVSWDDAETLKLKIDHANERCLGGTMVWAIDLDDGTLIEALGANIKRNKSMVMPFETEWDMQTRNVEYLIGST